MFPRTETRIRMLFRRSIDAAIDFATLGEYGYAPAWELSAGANFDDAHGRTYAADLTDWGFGDDSWGSVAGDDAVGAPGSQHGSAALLAPASAAGRARRNDAHRAAPVCAGQPVRGRALTPQLPRASRQRDGMAPRLQHCTDA